MTNTLGSQLHTGPLLRGKAQTLPADCPCSVLSISSPLKSSQVAGDIKESRLLSLESCHLSDLDVT